jgi:hypothetical protein
MYHKIVSKRREITITFCHRDGHSLHSPNIFLLIDSRNILSGLLEGNHRRENSKFAMHGWRRWWRQDSSFRNHSLLRVARLCKNESRSRRSRVHGIHGVHGVRDGFHGGVRDGVHDGIHDGVRDGVHGFLHFIGCIDMPCSCQDRKQRWLVGRRKRPFMHQRMVGRRERPSRNGPNDRRWVRVRYVQ